MAEQTDADLRADAKIDCSFDFTFMRFFSRKKDTQLKQESAGKAAKEPAPKAALATSTATNRYAYRSIDWSLTVLQQ